VKSERGRDRVSKTTIRRSALAVVTCPQMDSHGITKVTLRYRESEPLVFSVSLWVISDALPEPEHQTVELPRDAILGLLDDGVYGEILVIGQTSVKVRESARHQVCFKLPARPEDDGVCAMFIMATALVREFLADTYRAVPAESEVARVEKCVDAFIAEVLSR
jgi:hypothetical protein